MTATTPSPPVTPYRSPVAPGRAGFGQLLRAEWTKFRSVRGLLVGVIVAGLLTVVVSLLYHGSCGMVSPSGSTIGCPGAPLGPDGEAVTDNFYFAHQPLPSDGTITVRVASLTGVYSPSGGMSGNPANPLAGFLPGVQPWAKVGVMIKASTAQGAAYAAMAVTGANGVRMQYDYTGDIAGLPGAVTAAPRWLRLARSGDVITGYDSLDGTHWTQVGRVTLPGLPATAQVGLFAASPTYVASTSSIGGGGGSGAPTIATAAFDHVALPGAGRTLTGTTVGGALPLGAPGPGQGTVAQNPFNGGYQQSEAGTYTVSGSGDIAPDVPDAPDGVGTSPTSAIESGTFFALVVMVIIGAVFITAEYRRGLIRTTLTASPRRGRVLAAKAVVLGAVTFTVGLIGTAIALPAGESRFRAGGYWVLPLSGAATARMVVGTAAVMALASVLALAIGVLVRRGAAAVTAVIVVIMLPFLFAILSGVLPTGAENWLLRVFPAAAFAVQQAFPAYHQVTGSYLPANGYYPLTWWAGLAVLCAWTALALAAAAYQLKRRDA